MSKKKRKLLPFVPSEDPKRRLEQMASLATALTATKTEFSNELTYMPGMAPRSANCPALEHGGMQVINLSLCQLDEFILNLVQCERYVSMIFDVKNSVGREAFQCVLYSRVYHNL